MGKRAVHSSKLQTYALDGGVELIVGGGGGGQVSGVLYHLGGINKACDEEASVRESREGSAGDGCADGDM